MSRSARDDGEIHAALKIAGGRSLPGLGRVLAAAAVLFLAGAAVWGAYAGAARLYGLWIAQCAVRDVKSQIRIKTTPHVNEDHVRELFGLTNGCNLARMDFGAKRELVLKKHPIIKDIKVTRRLPDRLEIVLSERKPIVRVVSGDDRRKAKGFLPWNVADEDGVVFGFTKKDTGTLPMVIVPGSLPARGERLSGKPLSALRLVSLCESAGIQPQDFPEVSSESQIYMKITTRAYSTVNISWGIVDSPDDPSQANLRRILANYRKMAATRLAPDRSVFWITDLDSIQMEEPKL